jgi:hypothetical protein
VWLQFVSHKLGRLVVPYALLVMFLASAFLVTDHPIYGAAFAAQVLFYGLAVYGAVLDRRGVPAGAGRVKEEEVYVTSMHGGAD